MSEAVNVMEGKRVKIESKCDTSCNDGVDRISQLSDGIIVRILSYLWLNTAARTSVLSTRWYDLWRYIPILELYDASLYTRVSEGERSWDDEKVKFIEWVNSIVEKHKAHSLKKLFLFCNLDKSSHSAITKWLEFAFSKRVEMMRLTFQDDAEENTVVLDELLRLRPSNLLKSSNLKSLCLSCLNVSGEAIKLILRDCHLLEGLIIRNAVFTSDIEVCGGATGLVLKHLEMSRCSGGKSIKVSAPNLTCLKIDELTEVSLLIENVSKLVEVEFGSSRASNIQDFCFVSQLQILTIGSFCPLDFLAKGIPTMPKLMELNVYYYGRSKYLLPTLTSLVRASPLLQTFNLEFWGHIYDSHEQLDMEVGNVETFEHHHLRVFKFSGFDVEAVDHMELVSFILDNCIDALRKIIIKVRKSYRNLLPNVKRAKREADMEKVKQLLQPNLPTHIQLQTTIV